MIGRPATQEDHFGIEADKKASRTMNRNLLYLVIGALAVATAVLS
jgi:hypothetical protein